MTHCIAAVFGFVISTSALAGVSDAIHSGTVGVSATATINGPWGWNVGDAPSRTEFSTSGANFTGIAEVNALTTQTSGTSRAAYSQSYRNDGFRFQSELFASISPGPNAPVITGSSSHVQMDWNVLDSATLTLAGTSAADGLAASANSSVAYVFYRYLSMSSSDVEIVSQNLSSAGSPVNFTATVSSGRYGMVVWHDLQVSSFASTVVTSSTDIEFQIVSIPNPASAGVLGMWIAVFGTRSRRRVRFDM
ncbi:MAG TPA: hypothetical protein VK157_10735 [Phycisphaerales bacterium]|nr:hypothetical protein [Phycisphaerales bacterium]